MASAVLVALAAWDTVDDEEHDEEHDDEDDEEKALAVAVCDMNRVGMMAPIGRRQSGHARTDERPSSAHRRHMAGQPHGDTSVLIGRSMQTTHSVPAIGGASTSVTLYPGLHNIENDDDADDDDDDEDDDDDDDDSDSGDSGADGRSCDCADDSCIAAEPAWRSRTVSSSRVASPRPEPEPAPAPALRPMATYEPSPPFATLRKKLSGILLGSGRLSRIGDSESTRRDSCPRSCRSNGVP